jgi:spermidine synthase
MNSTVMHSRPNRSVLPYCLFVSGAAALIYEIVWLRQISLVMGHTVYALSAVLTAFLGGLALGADVGGRWVQRRGASIRLYAGIELMIACGALAVPGWLWLIEPVFGIAYRGLGSTFVLLSFAQFALCAAVLLVPTLLIGMTLPIVIALLTSDEGEIAIEAGWLYALSTFGGVVGAGMAGLVLLPQIGQWGTTIFAAALNLGVAIAAMCSPSTRACPNKGPAHRVEPAKIKPQSRLTPGWTSPPHASLVLLYSLAGFAALALEVAWVRIVSLSIGSTTYGFTITLVTYISGIAVGSLVLPRLRWISSNPVRAIISLHILVSVWTLLSLPYLGTLPIQIAALMNSAHTFESLFLSELLLVFVTIAVPTIAMGGIFPLVANLLHRAHASAGRAVGSAYTANTLGSIAGSLAAGFVLVPWIGMRGTIILSAVLTAVVGLGYLLPNRELSSRAKFSLASAVVFITSTGAYFLPHWDQEIVTSGPYVHGKQVYSYSQRKDVTFTKSIQLTFGPLIDYQEGPTTVVAVRKPAEDYLQLWVGGILEGTTQGRLFQFLGHLPMSLHGSARKVLIVGLGSGTTLSSVVKHAVEHVDSVEISPEVVGMARKHFAPFLGGALDDPRVRVLVGDGRNHLRHSQNMYDVIVSQPTYPWVSGAASLFTHEYFSEIKEHLAPGGIACVWFDSESEDISDSIIRTWQDVFPNAYLFAPLTARQRNVLIGYRDDDEISMSSLDKAMAIPAVKSEMTQAGFRLPQDVLARLAAGPDDLAKQQFEAPINTDENGYVEFHAFPDSIDARLKQYVFIKD